MNALKRRSTQWTIINVVGMAGYLTLASAHWISPAEFGTPGGPGDAFYTLFFLLPTLFFFAVIDLAALVAIIRRGIRGQAGCAFLVWLAVVACWVATLAFDRQMSFNIIDAAYV